jgi:hypothetical protein
VDTSVQRGDRDGLSTGRGAPIGMPQFGDALHFCYRLNSRARATHIGAMRLILVHLTRCDVAITSKLERLNFISSASRKLQRS